MTIDKLKFVRRYFFAQNGSRTETVEKFSSSLKSFLITVAGSKNHIPNFCSRSSRSNQPQGGLAMLTPPTLPRNEHPTLPTSKVCSLGSPVVRLVISLISP